LHFILELAIYQSGKHLLDLINDILDMTKIEAGKLEIRYDDFDISGTGSVKWER
jgi:signal transduction histidine kinase